MDQTEFYFGRLNVIGPDRDKKDFLLSGLSSRKPVERNNVSWIFTHITEISMSEGDFISGYLTKYRLITTEEVVKPELGVTDAEAIENLTIAKAQFFLHVETGLIAFHTVGRDIETGQFCSRFAEVFQRGHDDFFVNAEIQIIQESFEFLEMLSKFQSTTRLFIYLHPSNPHLNGLWANVDEDLKRKGADKYTEVYQAGGKSPTLHISDDPGIRSKVVMAQDGYGKAVVTGLLDGRKKTVSTSDNPVSETVPSVKRSPAEMLGDLMPAFRRIMARFNRQTK